MGSVRVFGFTVLITGAFAWGCSEDASSDDEPEKSHDSGGAGGVGEEAPDCYSPEEPSTAYDSGAQGCECPWPSGSSICIGPAALICEDSQWVAVEDGPCALTTDGCDGTVDDATGCLEQFETCTETPDGGFCGRDRR